MSKPVAVGIVDQLHQSRSSRELLRVLQVGAQFVQPSPWPRLLVRASTDRCLRCQHDLHDVTPLSPDNVELRNSRTLRAARQVLNGTESRATPTPRRAQEAVDDRL